ncbi:MAG: helix-turn-helix domain-containing protein [Bacteroidales bacterium]|jgi:hypothetical protein|nr:helix-turn-helix domain-containing protein [Bacteroidales bacterium]
MDVITMESKAYQELVDKINSIAEFIAERNDEPVIDIEEEWVDSYEVCTFLNISQRTLQRLRTKRLIAYSLISGKTYYTIAEIKRVLSERLIRTNEGAIQNLIDNHKTYAQQRRIAKKDK